MNYNQNAYEYGFDFDKTCAIIYLKKRTEPLVKDENTSIYVKILLNPEAYTSSRKIKYPRMYEVLITYNEFLRHPDVFKDFIKSPKKFTKWNFWCKELKYNQEKFDKKFQIETSAK